MQLEASWNRWLSRTPCIPIGGDGIVLPSFGAFDVWYQESNKKSKVGCLVSLSSWEAEIFYRRMAIGFPAMDVLDPQIGHLNGVTARVLRSVEGSVHFCTCSIVFIMFSDVFPLEGPGCQAAFNCVWLCLRMRIVLSGLGTLVQAKRKRERERLRDRWKNELVLLSTNLQGEPNIPTAVCISRASGNQFVRCSVHV